jgi:hypothetical protein
MVISLPVEKNQDDPTSQENSNRDINNSQPPQQQSHSSFTRGETQVSVKSMHTIHNSRRPIKKRTRPQLLSDMHYHTISPQPATKSDTHWQPENLQEGQPFPECETHRNEGHPKSGKTSTLSGQDQQPLANEPDNESVTMSEDEAPFSSSVPTVVTPPRLQRNIASFFPSTRRHQKLMKELTVEPQKTFFPFSKVKATMPSFLSSFQGVGKDLFSKKIIFEECFDDEVDEEDEHWIGEDALHDMYREVLKLMPGVEVSFIHPPPTQLSRTESDSMCIMMKDLFEPSSRPTSIARAMVPKPIDRSTKGGFVARTPQMQTKYDMCDDVIGGAFSMMQQEMIATPKRSFRFKGNSFSSFASSASGSSRSSCVTPSPAKRMMTSAMKRDIQMPNAPYGHRPSLSFGSVDESSETLSSRDGYIKMSAPTLPELADSVMALERVSNRYWLTDQQKVDRVKPFISIPPKPKLPPRHIGRTLSATKSRREKGKGHSDGRFGSKRSFSEEMTRDVKRPPGDDGTVGTVIDHFLKSDAVGATHPEVSVATKTQTQHREHGDISTHKIDEGIFPDFAPTCQPSSHGSGSQLSSHDDNNWIGSSISWIEHQQQMFNPHEISTPASGSGGSCTEASIRTSKQTP